MVTIMKKVLLLLILALLFPSCDKDSGGSNNKSFRVQPGDLTAFNSPATSYSITYNGTTYTQGATGHSIIYTGTIDGTEYVGISVSDNPDPESTESFNLKVYFQSSTIPSSVIIPATSATIVIYNGTTHTGISGGPITLNFTSLGTTGLYTTYSITSSGSIDINGLTLSGINITALKAP
jgi:hypothetical protein